MLWIVIASGLLAVTARPDGPGGHHHGAHHGDHGAHHGAHGAHHGDHGAQGAHHGDHGVHNAQHGAVVQSTPVQHQVVHSSVQRPVSASFSLQPQPQPQPHSSALVKAQAGPVESSHGPRDIGQLVATHPKLTTLKAAVEAAGLQSTLASSGPFTLFAPTNLAFKKLPEAQLAKLLGNKAALSKILLRHVVPGSTIQGRNIPPGITSLKTAGGDQITATRDKFIQIKSKDGSAYIVLFDIAASNGVIHAVDTVF